MQEVAKLRRSLDDAEGLSRDTKKEWAVLRSQNIALDETVVSWITELNSINSLAQQLIECVAMRWDTSMVYVLRSPDPSSV